MDTRVQLEDQTGIINSLQAHIRQLESVIETERSSHALADAVGEVIKRLRLHGVILLDLVEADKPRHSDLSFDVVLHTAFNQAWKLDKAPLADTLKDSVREAANHGMSRW